MTQQSNLSMSATLRRIRENAGFTLADLAEKTRIPAERLRAFEECILSSQRLLTLYGVMAQLRKTDDDRQL